MIKWIKELFKPPVDRTEMRIREQFQFMFVDYGFSFDKVDLGNLVDKNGKVIPGSKRAKIEKYIGSLNLTAAQKHMLMGYLGYKNKLGKEKVEAYINRLKLTRTEKAALLTYSGYGTDS